MAGDEALLESLGLGRVAGNGRTQVANERQSALVSLGQLGNGLGLTAYRGWDALDQDLACSRIDKEIGAPSFAFLNLHTISCLSSHSSRQGNIRGGNADSQERGVPVLGTVGVVVHQTDGLPIQTVRFTLGEDGGKSRNGFRAQELARLHGSLLDGRNTVGGDIVQGDFHGDGEGSEGCEKKERDGETHREYVSE